MAKMRYTLENEEAKRRFVEKELMKGILPIVCISFKKGFVAVVPNSSEFRKIREIHDNIMLAAVGEHQAINEVASGLVRDAFSIEKTFSSKDVFIDVLIDNPVGVVGVISSSFHSTKVRPKVIEFALLTIDNAKTSGVVINSCGERKYISDGAVIRGKDEMTSSLEASLKNSLPDTEEDAIVLATNLLKEFYSKDITRVEIGILKDDGSDPNFSHKVEDIK